MLASPPQAAITLICSSTGRCGLRCSITGSAVASTIQSLRGRAPAVLGRGFVWHVAPPLDVAAMQEGARHLVGHHDFSTFRDSLCQAKSPVKTLDRIDIAREDDVIRFDLHADAFLQHMVRNIVGALVYAGSGRQAPEWIAELLQSRDRKRGAPTFGACGLYLTGIDYPQHWNLPPTVVPLSIPRC